MNLTVHFPKIARIYNTNNKNNDNLNIPNFNLKMAQPLQYDTVSFGISATNKKGNLKKMVNKKTAEDVVEIMREPHEKMKELLLDEFGDLTTDKYGKPLVTFGERLKGIFSIQQKTGSREWFKQDEILRFMNDLSGFCFILEDRRAFTECINRFIKLIKSGKIIIPQTEEINAGEIKGLPVEYHVIPPEYKRGKITESFDSLQPHKLQELKKTLIDVYQPATRMSDTIDSISGYSGLHIIVKTHGGHFSEVKFLTRSMADVQKIENLFYKKRNGKAIDPKYSYIEPIIQDLAPLPEYATDKEIKEHEKLSKAISKYTLEVYKDALKHPFQKDAPMPKPTDPLIAKFDFNNLRKLMKACEEM